MHLNQTPGSGDSKTISWLWATNPSVGCKPGKNCPLGVQRCGVGYRAGLAGHGPGCPSTTQHLGGGTAGSPTGEAESQPDPEKEGGGAGGSGSGTPPPQPPPPESLLELAGCDSRGRPFPVFRTESSLQGCAGQSWAAGPRTRSFRTKVCRPRGQLSAGPARSASRLPRRPHPAGALGARGIVLARLPLRGPRPMAFGVSARAFHSPGGKAERARKRPAPGDSRARPAPCLAAPPAPPRPRALTCAARRRRPQQQQQQQQRRRRGQQRGARAQRAARFPAGVDVHAGGARGGARGDPRGRGARPGQRTRWGRHDLRKAWGASTARSLCGGGSPARVGARARPRAGRLDLGPRGGRDPARLARPRLLQLLRLLLASPGRRRPATRSPCALRSSEVLSQPRGRGVRT